MTNKQLDLSGSFDGFTPDEIEIFKSLKFDTFFNHDITHCSNSDCPKKNTCNRYIMHLDALRNELDYLSYFIEDAMPKDGNCSSYWEYKL